MKRHLCLLLSVFVFCYCNGSHNFKAPYIATNNVVEINAGSTEAHNINSNSYASGYYWPAMINDSEIISVEAGLHNEMQTQMDASRFSFKIKGKHKGKTKVYFQYKKPGQTNMALSTLKLLRSNSDDFDLGKGAFLFDFCFNGKAKRLTERLAVVIFPI